jgi:Cd2+/Zn2+-exporting ATPase
MHWLGVPPLLVNATYTLAIVAGGYYIVRSGWAALRTTHSLDMNALMSIAAIGAMAIGEWEEGATAMLLFSLGNTLEALTMDRARQAIRKLVQLSPREATRVHGGHADRVPVEQLRVGDLIEVKPGERVPMDGVVQQGSSTLDQAPITGESSPVDAAGGSAVFAGSINGHGRLLVEVTKLAKDNTLSRIVQMVQEAQSRRAPAQRFVDTFARYYTPSVIALAAGVAVLPPLLLAVPFSTWFYRALVLLVIACPCALVISTPVAIVSAISNAARHGVLIKGGMHLEAIARVHAVAFDKTGTLTEGKAAVTDVEPVGSSDPLAEAADAAALRDGAVEPVDRLLALAASIEAHSQHPVARAVCDEAQRRGLSLLPIQDYQELTGHGAQARINGHTYYVGKHQLFCERVPHAQRVCQRVDELEAQGKTAILVGNERDVLGVIAVADRVRDTSASVVQTLRNLGIAQSVLLSGDNERTAQAIARLVGIDHVQANLLPQDKVTAVEGLLAQYGQVAMVGDGVNDAPALARSSVGIAMGAAGSDAALETADIVLMSDDLRRIPYVIRLGRRTLSRIRENIALSLVIKGVFLLLAVGGVATLWMAVFADMGTSLIVTLNGMRLLREE